VLVVIVLALLTSAASAADPETEVVTTSGATVAGRLTEWTASQLVIRGDVAHTLPAADVWTITFPAHRLRPVEGDWLILANGDRVAASVRRVRDNRVDAEWTTAPLRPRWSGPLESVSALVFNLPAAPRLRRLWLAAIENAPAGADQIQFVTGERLVGEFTHLEGQQIAMTASFGATQLERQRVRWVRLDRELQSFPDVETPWWCVWLTDGSRITATDCRPGENLDVQLALPLGGSFAVPWHEVARLQRFGREIAPLSRRTPKSTSYTPYLSGERTLHRDRNVQGSPLVVRGTEAAVGLGMVSAMSATYRIEPQDREFRAQIGIDDAAEGKGSARFRILLDGRATWESDEITGQSPLATCPPVSLKGAKELTLQVDFGDAGDVGDYADWLDAVIVRGE
jgi:hypothetical protein